LRAIGDTGVDFVLDDPARGGDGTGSTREMPQSHTVTLDVGEGGHDAPTVENLQPPGLDSPTIRQKLDASAYAQLGGVQLGGTEQTAELAIDDLGLDITGGDTGKHNTGDAGSAPTMLTALDEDTRELLARAEAQVVTPDTAEMPAAASTGTGSSGTWLFTDKDFSSVLPAMGGATDTPTELVTAVMPGPDSGQAVTAQLEALKGRADSIVDLDLDSLETTGNREGVKLDLDVGRSGPAPDTGFAATQRLVAEPLASDAEPATMSEVGTKLDLARAYMDMGDPEGARSILEEVLAEGSASQKTEARRLVDSLPG
jgi:pilus assembly protein FimV